MSNRFIALSAAAALSLAALTSSASASEPGAVDGAKTTGALTFETRGLATRTAEVRAQGGFASAGAVRWTRLPTVQAKAGAEAF